MNQLRERLQDWTDAGLISADQADLIVAHEAARAPDSATQPRPAQRPPAHAARSAKARLTSPAEAIGYVGAALALGAIALILGDLWQELLLGGRLALVGVLTLALFGAGVALRSSTAPAMQRLTSVLFTGTAAGTGWFAAVIASDILDLRHSAVATSVGATVLVTAGVLYLWRPRALLQLATLGAGAFTAGWALSLSPLDPGTEWYGLVVGTVGVAWFLLALGGWLTPRTVGQVAGALVGFLGVQIASFGDLALLALAVGLVMAAALVVLAIRVDALHHLIVGALALFVLSPQLVFELFGDAIGAPATLLLVGLLLVLLAVGLGRARREVIRDTADDDGGH